MPLDVAVVSPTTDLIRMMPPRSDTSPACATACAVTAFAVLIIVVVELIVPKSTIAAIGLDPVLELAVARSAAVFADISAAPMFLLDEEPFPGYAARVTTG